MTHEVLEYYIDWLKRISHNTHVFSVSTPRTMSLWVLGHTVYQLNVCWEQLNIQKVIYSRLLKRYDTLWWAI